MNTHDHFQKVFSSTPAIAAFTSLALYCLRNINAHSKCLGLALVQISGSAIGLIKSQTRLHNKGLIPNADRNRRFDVAAHPNCIVFRFHPIIPTPVSKKVATVVFNNIGTVVIFFIVMCTKYECFLCFRNRVMVKYN